jgi:N utilization substance protein B
VAARTKARKRALDVVFEADQRGVPVLTALEERRRADPKPLNPYTVELVEGVAAHAARIDDLLSTYSMGWTLERMPAVDRAVLRLGAYELLYGHDVPDAVCIDEAVGLARELSTEESPAFVNGLLARLLELKPSLTGSPD